MAKLNVEVVTPERRLVQMAADEVIAPGADGLFGVRPNHTPYLALLQAGPLTVRDGVKAEVFFVSGGFVEAGPQAVRVLADSAEPAKSIDSAAATKRLSEAEAALKSLVPGDPKGDVHRARVAVEKRRLEVAAMK
jgi:F-type H+-transporting ATPase subunit epsilon